MNGRGVLYDVGFEEMERDYESERERAREGECEKGDGGIKY